MSDPSNLQLTLSLRATDQGLVGTVREANREVGKFDEQLDQAAQTTVGFSEKTQEADKDTEGFGKKLAGGALTAAKWAAGMAAAGVAAAGFAVALNVDAIREVDQFGQVLGTSTQVMTEWQYAADVMTATGVEVADTFVNIRDKIGDVTVTGGGEAIDLFESVNIQARDLIDLSPDQQLLAIADALDDLNRNQQVFFLEGLASDASQLLPLLENNASELKRLQLEAQVLGVSINDIDAAKVTQAGQAFGRVGGVIKGITNEATVALAPVLTGIADSLVDSAVEAGGFEAAMIGAVDSTVSGIGFVLDVGQRFLIWGKYAQLGMLALGQQGAGAMASIADTTAALINLSLYPLQQTIAWITGGLADLISVGASLGGPFAESFQEASQWLKTLSGDVEQFHVRGSDIAALNERLQTSFSNAATELYELLNSNAPSEDLQAWVQRLREESEQAAQAQVDLRAETAATGQIVGQGVDVSPYEKLTKELEDQLALVGLSAREIAIETQLRKLNADATKAQKTEIERLAGELYDAQEQESLIDLLFDINADDLQAKLDPVNDLITDLQERLSMPGLSDEMKKNIGDGIKRLQSDIEQIKFDHVTDSAKEGLRGFQSMAEEGSKGYQAIGIAVDALSAVQAVNAVIKQLSEGDPYTAFARAGVAAAAVASLGYSVGNFGGSDTTVADRQAAQGTGTVLGDSTAKSESILNAVEITADSTQDLVGINRSMLGALERLSQGIDGAVTRIARGAGDITLKSGSTPKPDIALTGALGSGAAVGAISYSVFGGVASSISSGLSAVFGPAGILGGLIAKGIDDLLGGTLTKLVGKAIGAKVKGKDTGIRIIGGQLDELMDSTVTEAFSKWKQRKNWFSSYKSKELTEALDDDVNRQFSLVFQGLYDSVQSGAEMLGLLPSEVQSKLDNFVIETMDISLKGLSPEEQQAELEAVFSTVFDSLSLEVVPFLGDMQRAGEGLGETLARVAGNVQVFDHFIERLGAQFSEVSLSADAESKTYLIDAAGGVDAFSDSVADFVSNFKSEEEQFEILTGDLSDALAQHNEVLPATRQGFVALLEAQDVATESGANLVAELLRIQGPADEYYDALEKEAQLKTKAAAEIRADYSSLAMLIDDALDPLSDAENSLLKANRAMSALGMTGLTYHDALVVLDDYDTDALVGLADALGMSFEDIQDVIQAIINGNEQITGGGSGTLSVSAAESAVDAAESVIWKKYGDIINDTFGGQIPTLEEFSNVYGGQIDQLKTIQSDNSVIIGQLGGMPSSVAELTETYFDQFDGLTLVEPVDDLGKQIAGAYQTFLGRLPDQDGLDYWLDQISDDVSVDDVINSIAGTAEAAEYGLYQDLRADMQSYFDDYDADVIGMDTALAAWDAANESYSQALIDSADSATGAVNNAANSFLAGIQNELGGFDLEGEDLEQYELDLWYSNMVAQANELGVELTQLNELYGKKQVAITEKYAQEAVDELQKALDFDANIQSQIDSFYLDGEQLELFNLDKWRESQIKQAKKVDGDVELIEELFGKKRVQIVEKYADEALEAAQKAAEQQVEDAGLNDYLQSVSDYVDEQSKVIEDHYRDQIAVIEQWQDVARDLSDYVDQIRLSELSPAGPAEKLAAAQESFAQLLVAAEAGDLEAAGKLSGAADTYLGLADQYYGRSDAYTAEFGYVTNALEDLGIDLLAVNDQDAIERLNEQMKGELEDLSRYARDELEYARQQASALTGIDTALGDWPDRFDTMLGDLATDISNTVTTAIPGAPDRPVISGGSVAGTGDQQTTDNDYSSVDITDPVSGGMSVADATDIIHASLNGGVNSDDYIAAAETLGITSYDDLADFIHGSHADGLNNVPFDDYRAKLHKGEMVLTADVADHIRQSMRVSVNSQNVTDPALIRLIESLVASNERLEAEVEALRSERSNADKVANQKRDDQIRATKKSGRSTVETV